MMDDIIDCGAVGGIRIGRANGSTGRKPTPALFYLPHNPHDMTWARTCVTILPPSSGWKNQARNRYKF
jgi:hypothetical protein